MYTDCIIWIDQDLWRMIMERHSTLGVMPGTSRISNTELTRVNHTLKPPCSSWLPYFSFYPQS